MQPILKGRSKFILLLILETETFIQNGRLRIISWQYLGPKLNFNHSFP